MDGDRSKYYAIVPAAGSSTRMGRPKLLLPWPTIAAPQGTVLDHVLRTWRASGVRAVVVVCRPDDERLVAICRKWHADVVQPAPIPQDMKASVQCGLEHLETRYQPRGQDACFIAPADVPGIRVPVIHGLMRAHHDSGESALFAPTFGGKAGHPVLLGWPLTPAVFELGANEGLNRLVSAPTTRLIAFDAALGADDLDTPEDYERELKRRRQFE